MSTPYCSRCGFEVREEWQFCSRCGSSLNASLLVLREKEQAEFELQKAIKQELWWSGGRWMDYFFIGYIVFCAVFLVFYFYLHFVLIGFEYMDGGFLTIVWVFILYSSMLLHYVPTFWSLRKVNRSIKQGVTQAAYNILRYYDFLLRAEHYYATFLLAYSLTITGIWFIGSSLGLWRCTPFMSILYIFIAAFGIGIFIAYPYLNLNRTRAKKRRIQDLLARLEKMK